MKKPNVLQFDSLVELIAAFGVPGLILTGAIGATGLVGAAAITAALASIGPGGMILGIATLGVAGLVAQGISKYTFEALFRSVVKSLYNKGETKESILEKIEHYKISNSLKLKLKEEINNL